MWISHAIWRNPLRWNEGWSGGILKPQFILHVEVEITTNAMSLWNIYGKRKDIHEMIMGLHAQGYLDKYFAKTLNVRNIPNLRNRVWLGKNVWAARDYLRKREERRTQTS